MSLPHPVALCLEDTDAAAVSERYLCCVALSGGLPGLGVSRDGRVQWQRQVGLECELWVSQDECLMVERLPGAGEIVVSRAGRSLSIPEGRPVELIQDDTLQVAGRTFTVHVHGVAETIHAPLWLPDGDIEVEPTGLFESARNAAAAAVVGVALAATACKGSSTEETSVAAGEIDTGKRDASPIGSATVSAQATPQPSPSAAATREAPASSASAMPSAKPVPRPRPKPIRPRPRPPKPMPNRSELLNVK